MTFTSTQLFKIGEYMVSVLKKERKKKKTDNNNKPPRQSPIPHCFKTGVFTFA